MLIFDYSLMCVVKVSAAESNTISLDDLKSRVPPEKQGK